MTAPPTPLRETVARIADTMTVIANNPYSAGGLQGQRDLMKRLADQLRAALSTRAVGSAYDGLCPCCGEIECEEPATPPASGEAAPNMQKCAGCGSEWPDYLFKDGKCIKCRKTTPPAASGVQIEVKPSECACHPETCNCPEYFVAVNGELWSKGDRGFCERLAEKIRRLAAVAPAAGAWVLVPRRLTAENGAKAALIGEFSFRDGTGAEQYVPWHVIKQIHNRVVETFASTTPPATAGKE